MLYFLELSTAPVRDGSLRLQRREEIDFPKTYYGALPTPETPLVCANLPKGIWWIGLLLLLQLLDPLRLKQKKKEHYTQTRPNCFVWYNKKPCLIIGRRIRVNWPIGYEWSDPSDKGRRGERSLIFLLDEFSYPPNSRVLTPNKHRKGQMDKKGFRKMLFFR